MLDQVSHTLFSTMPDQSPAAGALAPGSVFPPWVESLIDVKISVPSVVKVPVPETERCPAAKNFSVTLAPSVNCPPDWTHRS